MVGADDDELLPILQEGVKARARLVIRRALGFEEGLTAVRVNGGAGAYYRRSLARPI